MTAPRKLWISGIDRLLAERAAEEADLASEKDPAWKHGGHAITAIILAVSAFQAHVGEWLAVPSHGAQFSSRELRKLRFGPAYEAASAILVKRGTSYDPESKPWFHRLKGLHELRNHVAHYTPEKRDTGSFPTRLQQYLDDGTFVPAGDSTMDWTSRLVVKAVALQAVMIAREANTQFDRGVDGWVGA